MRVLMPSSNNIDYQALVGLAYIDLLWRLLLQPADMLPFLNHLVMGLVALRS